ncbi:hypothetical protein [Paenibacillus gansuensis]|uniref:Uncharacterized protein n=1 Tax=Paenibacillus gansuensis TaxID=306542 RepID=A0ABW5PF61_9BACL
MDKLALILVVSIMVVGIGFYMFLRDGGLSTKLQEGHAELQDDVKQWGYTTAP